jgi:hypothetical protein
VDVKIKKLKLQTGENNPSYKHGFAKKNKVAREYKIWAGIKTRCCNKNCKIFEHYGGRGITICDRWINSFENFIEDMGIAPTNKSEIDRMDVNGNYEKENCRWSSRKEQNNNTRTNKLIVFNGVYKTYAQWEEELGLRKRIIGQRKRQSKWNDEYCLKIIQRSS